MPAPNTETGLRHELRRGGLRSTAPRLAVLRLLRRARLPLSHGEVVARLQQEGWDRATLYRNLVDLARAGLARRTDLGDHVWRFAAAGPPTAHHHPHFVCRDCGQVACLEKASVRVQPGSTTQAALRNDEYEVLQKGRCDRCRKDGA